jgi:hypothetical protein
MHTYRIILKTAKATYTYYQYAESKEEAIAKVSEYHTKHHKKSTILSIKYKAK